MNATPEYLEIAKTDFEKLYRDDPRKAEDRMVMLICDPELAAKRIVSLVRHELIGDLQKGHSDNDGPSAFDGTIEALREWGPLPALRKQLVTFDDLVKLSLNPAALRLAHQAVLEVDFNGESNGTETLDSTMIRTRAAAYDLVTDDMEMLSLGAASDDEDDEHDDWIDIPTTSGLPSLIQCFDDWAEIPHEEFVEKCRAAGIVSSAKFDLHTSLCGAPEKNDADVPTSQEAIAFEQGMVSIFAPVSMIPDGLCRLTLIEVGAERTAQRVISLLPQLKLDGDHWYWEKSIHELFGRNMTGTIIRPALEVTTRSDFRCPEIQVFVAELPQGEQKTRAQSYLTGKKGQQS